MLPANFKPMLATISEPFDSSEYIYEIKWDGYRCLAFLDSQTRLQSRNLKNISYLFPELQLLHQKIRQPGCILDGEVIALRKGKPSFLELQKRAQLKKTERIKGMMRQIPVIYVVFDLLYLNYQPIYHNNLDIRRALLSSNIISEEELVLANFIEKKGTAYFESIVELGLEGVIAKKKDSPYLPGKRVKHWLKFKSKKLGNFLIAGFLLSPSDTRSIRSLILGAYFSGLFQYFGMVGTGFSEVELAAIRHELEKIQTEICPFILNTVKEKNLVWTRPIIPCTVEYLELTDEGILRHPSFKKFRPDLNPADCQFEG